MLRFVFISFLLISFQLQAQSCEDWLTFVKENHIQSTSYPSDFSTAVKEVTFYQVEKDSIIYHFAIVCFVTKSTFGCREYIYQVSDSTELYYSLAYKQSAGKAFWKYIKPFDRYLGCGRAN